MHLNDNLPQEICILRLSALGDVTHAIPAIRAIQSEWPNVSITWICGKFEYKLLSQIEGIRFVVFDKQGGLKAYLKVWRELEGQRFDLMLHMHATARANLLSFFIRARIKLGWDDANARDGHRWFIDEKIKAEKSRHQVQAYLEFVRTLGIEIDEPEWDFPISEEAQRFVKQHIQTESPVLVISPCSSHVLRNWKTEHYAKVADFAIEKLDMTVVLSGGPSALEHTTGEEIENRMVNNPVNLIGKDTIPQLVALLHRADVLISPDSGPVHIANAVGTKVVGLYACTNSRRSGPYNSLDYCVDKYADAANIFYKKNADNLAWNKKIEKAGVMDLITVEEVIERLQFAVANLEK